MLFFCYNAPLFYFSFFLRIPRHPFVILRLCSTVNLKDQFEKVKKITEDQGQIKFSQQTIGSLIFVFCDDANGRRPDP